MLLQKRRIQFSLAKSDMFFTHQHLIIAYNSNYMFIDISKKVYGILDQHTYNNVSSFFVVVIFMYIYLVKEFQQPSAKREEDFLLTTALLTVQSLIHHVKSCCYIWSIIVFTQLSLLMLFYPFFLYSLLVCQPCAVLINHCSVFFFLRHFTIHCFFLIFIAFFITPLSKHY